MARYYDEVRREKLFADMRARMAQKGAEQAGTPRQSAASYRRREHLNALPANLQFFRITELAEMLGVHPKTAARWFRSRAIKAGDSERGVRPKKTLLISRAEFMKWLEEHAR